VLTINLVGGVQAPCKAACDANGDGQTSGVADAVALLTANFIGGVAIPPPFPGCDTPAPGSDALLGCAITAAACR
jgi:hypothetical protein